jgi:hypothetical protein
MLRPNTFFKDVEIAERSPLTVGPLTCPMLRRKSSL